MTVAGGLVAWRWWLSDKMAVRTHELTLRQQAVQVEDAELRKLPARVLALEAALKEQAWKR